MRTFDIHGELKSLWQWDVNRCLVVNEYCDQVHFANRTTSEALTLQVYEENGQRLVNVPNILLQTDGPLEVYAYVMGPSERYTKKDCRLRVLARPKPADYVYTETEVLTYETLEKRIKKIEETGVSEEQIAQAVESYLNEHPVGGGVDFETDNTLILKDGVLSVNTTDQMEQDNTLPITSAGVYATVGNIDALLKTI